MTRSDKISSTEKLLRVIRGNLDENEAPENDQEARSHEKEVLTPIAKVFPFSKAITVGIIIGHYDLTLAMVAGTGEKKWKLLDYKKIQFKTSLDRDDEQFVYFLKSELQRFLGNKANVGLWCAIPSAGVDMRYIVIPKVGENQIPNAAYWTHKKQIQFDDRDAIFDFQVLGETKQNNSKKLKILSYTAPKTEVVSLKEIFTRAGFPLEGISIVPFALQNLFRTGIDTTEDICSLYIGRDWSRIDIFNKGDLVLSRDIKTGMNSFIEAIRGGLVNQPQESTIDGADEARKIFREFIHGGRVRETEDKIMDAIMPVLQRLVRQVDRTMGHFALHFNNASVNRLYISGEIIISEKLVDFIGSQINYPIGFMDPFNSNYFSELSNEPPESVFEKDSFAPAIGLAISDKSLTPNFIFTYLNKGIISRINRINKAVFAVFAIIIFILFGLYLYQGIEIKREKTSIASLSHRLDKYSPQVDKKLIQKLASKTRQNKKAMDSYAKNYLGAAVIGEISRLTPDSIKILSLKEDLGKTTNKKKKTLTIEGMVTGDFSTRESELAVYMVTLKESLVFESPGIIKKSIRVYKGREVLRFTARLNII